MGGEGETKEKAEGGGKVKEEGKVERAGFTLPPLGQSPDGAFIAVPSPSPHWEHLPHHTGGG